MGVWTFVSVISSLKEPVSHIEKSLFRERLIRKGKSFKYGLVFGPLVFVGGVVHGT